MTGTGVLLAYTVTLTSEETLVNRASNSARVGYKELCKHLPSENFFPCLCKTLESMFNLLRSHHGIMRWLQQRARELEAEEGGPQAPTLICAQEGGPPLHSGVWGSLSLRP